MASAAFKSTSKRSSIGPSSSSDSVSSSSSSSASNRHRRSRSLSQAPPPSRFPPDDDDDDRVPAPRPTFVTTLRGSGFPEISLDDLANDFFNADDDDAQITTQRSRSTRRSSVGTHPASGATTAARRGRSVSRHRAVDDKGIVGGSNSSGGAKGVVDRRRRSVSVARYQFSDSESDKDHSHKPIHSNVKGSDHWNYQDPSLHKPATSNHQRVLRRSLSQKDLLKSRDGYSSHSSALTDDETRDNHSNKKGLERTIRAVYAQKKTEHPTVDGGETELYEVMRKELRHAVEEIRTELEHGIVKMNHSVLANDDCLQSNKPDVLQAVAMIRNDYCEKLEQSAKRKQDLLAEIVVEDQRGRELSKIVKELLPDAKNIAPPKNPLRGRMVKNNDKGWMSKCLTEDAEKYFDDFISNVEDTDISSFDGERSDASSTMGVKKQRDPVILIGETACGPPTRFASDAVEMDGVVLPWLQWETTSDGSPISCNSKAQVQPTLQDKSHQAESIAEIGGKLFSSSRGSCSPGGNSPSVLSREDLQNRFGVGESYLGQSTCKGPKDSYFDMDEYLNIQQNEESVFERWRQRQRISSGALVLCSSTCLEL